MASNLALPLTLMSPAYLTGSALSAQMTPLPYPTNLRASCPKQLGDCGIGEWFSLGVSFVCPERLDVASVPWQICVRQRDSERLVVSFELGRRTCAVSLFGSSSMQPGGSPRRASRCSNCRAANLKWRRFGRRGRRDGPVGWIDGLASEMRSPLAKL